MKFLYMYIMPLIIPSTILIECYKVYTSNNYFSLLDGFLGASMAIMFYSIVFFVVKNELNK